ncbi:MAG: type III-A CRISPR-associated RAMP protein Csm4, partial [Halothece sp.]
SSEWEKLINFNDNSHYSLLSLYWQNPIPKNLISDATSYQVESRGGWASSPFSGQQLLRKKLRMFSEGSVFPISPKGELADVTPPNFNLHKIYRNGISISLPIQLQQES